MNTKDRNNIKLSVYAIHCYLFLIILLFGCISY